MKIYLVRHGQTDSNAKDLYVGMTDVALSQQGKVDAYALGQAFKNIKLDAVYCSDLSRSIDTAKEISKATGVALKQDSLMNEIDFGALEGHDFAFICENFPDVVEKWSSDVFDLVFPEGESFNDFSVRVRKFKNMLLSCPEDSAVAVVGHAGFLKLLTCDLMDIDDEHWWKFKFATSSISELQVDDNIATMLRFNDLSHNAIKDKQ